MSDTAKNMSDSVKKLNQIPDNYSPKKPVIACIIKDAQAATRYTEVYTLLDKSTVVGEKQNVVKTYN